MDGVLCVTLTIRYALQASCCFNLDTTLPKYNVKVCDYPLPSMFGSIV